MQSLAMTRKPSDPVTSKATAIKPASSASNVKRRRGAATTSPGHTEGLRETVEMSWSDRNQWVVYAVASGACAAFNGVFAKLTTNDLTTKISGGISALLGLESAERVLEIVVRCAFFGLNLAFNGVMWTLFTQALAKGQSTTQVSILNTSTNFMVTAILGFAIFSESLPPLWWVGATMLVAGNVIIGRKDEAEGEDGELDEQEEGQEDAVESGRTGTTRIEKDDEEDTPLLGNLEG
ncbi:hypothetical protein GGR57DRAFT_448083 [Xylariaceae sp. FL1272]|nr:hypothetical protein GGR57DRAFT_448083 [Xylariaceae sp. FL1272]